MAATLKGRPLVPGIDKPVSQLALGTAFYRFDNRDLWFDILDDFAASRGTVIDTARLYAGGDSEKLIGQWMEGRGAREKVVVIAKGGHGKDHALPTENFTESVTHELTTSLDCLRTDYADLYMLHRDNPLLPVAEIMDCLNVMLDDGRAQALGASNWEYTRVDEANEYADKHGLRGFVAVSNNLSLAVPTEPFWPGLVSVDEASERWHTRTGVPLISWSSQARGFFTGRYTPEMRSSADGIEDEFTRRMLTVYCTDENFERLRRAKYLGEQKGGYSAVQVALAWVLHKPFAVVPIVGPHTTEELTSCVEATSIKLTASEMAWLNLDS